MKPARRRLAKRISNFYKNVSANAPLFATNLLLYRFDRDLIATLVQTCKRLLKRHAQGETKPHEEYLLIFNYVIFSHLHFVLSELGQNNTPHFDIVYDLCESKCGNTPLLNAKRLTKRRKCSASKLRRLLIGGGTHGGLDHSQGGTPHLCSQGEQNETSYESYQPGGRRHKQTTRQESHAEKHPHEWNKHICHEGYRKRAHHWGSKPLGYASKTYGRVHISYKGERSCTVKYITNTCLHNWSVRRFPFCSSMECSEAGESQFVEQLKRLYAHVHYWMCLMQLNMRCRRSCRVGELKSEEKDIYDGIYKNIYNLFKRMNRNHFESIQMIKRKKQQLSITHNCEMEDLISATKGTAGGNSKGTQQINELVFKHIAEKEALCRHAEHEVKVMQLVNLKEYKEHIFYIFNILQRERNVLSLPPLPEDELEGVDAGVAEGSLRVQPNGFCPCAHKGGHPYFALTAKLEKLAKHFHLFYLHKLIKSNLRVVRYLHLHVRHSVCDTLSLSVVFSLGEVEDLFQRHRKSNGEFKGRLYGLLGRMHREHCVGSGGADQCADHYAGHYADRCPHRGTNGTPAWTHTESKYFDATGRFRSKLGAPAEEKAPFNKSYDSTHKYSRDDSIWFVPQDNACAEEESAHTHLSKVTLREKELNGLVLYVGEDANSFCKENVYQSIFSISMNKTDFVFPTLKEQLGMFRQFVSGNGEVQGGGEAARKSSPEMPTQLRCGNIIITRHTNLKIGMERGATPKGGEKSAKKGGHNGEEQNGGHQNGGGKKNKASPYDMTVIKNHANDFFSLERINTSNLPSSILPIYEQLKRNSHYFMHKEGGETSVRADAKESAACKLCKLGELGKPGKPHANILKKKKIHVDVIFHIIIPQNANSKSFQIILLSLLKVLDLCRSYHVSSLTCPLPYVHDVVHKNKRPVVYAFMYSLVFSLLNYVKCTQSPAQQVRVLHFVFPNLAFREGGAAGRATGGAAGGAADIVARGVAVDSSVEKKTAKKTSPLNEESPLHPSANSDGLPKERMSSMASFIYRVANDMRGKYTLVESI
ncbi:hypothetical protein PVIIG_03916 [Plasmodium vivax India VII]|uniref:Uncharacterized protein n=1 Tax=Plasmodium vivax India VII TaxID=1077284 RepID=A0A0J9S4F0_PLAVI|nr:hypothetical protein PVIIG_03916 [Plasmodium vivax India VII]